MPSISYAITVCDEVEEVIRLIKQLRAHLVWQQRPHDEIVVLWDCAKGGKRMQSLLERFERNGAIKLAKDKFQGHFGDWKNKLTSHCSGDYIFQIDADEFPTNTLIDCLPSLLESNPGIEVYLVPRINMVEGITPHHIEKWAWKVSPEGWVNFPDYQWRIYKNKPYIRWVNKVHERLDGFKTFAVLPPQESYCLHHPKTIERQERQNALYDTYQAT